VQIGRDRPNGTKVRVREASFGNSRGAYERIIDKNGVIKEKRQAKPVCPEQLN
jgi:hypothetical protein